MATLNYDLYKIIEQKFNKDEAKTIIKAIENALQSIENKAKEQKVILKSEIKDELTNELATKGDIGIVKQEILTLKHELLGKLKLYFAILIFLIIFLNQDTIEFILKLIGLLK